MKPKYKRIMLKLSGEGLMGDKSFGIDTEVVESLAKEIVSLKEMGVCVCLVIGGGNFFRGAKNATKDMDRSVADQIGMMATIINALSLKSSIEKLGCVVKIYSGLLMPQVCDAYNFSDAMHNVNEGNIVIFAGGTGNPYFTTDTGAALRAAEMHCDIIMKATQVDGVYDADPEKNSEAKRYDEITYAKVVEQHLNVMDITAITMAQDNNIPIMVFAQNGENAIIKAVCGEAVCTIIR